MYILCKEQFKCLIEQQYPNASIINENSLTTNITKLLIIEKNINLSLLEKLQIYKDTNTIIYGINIYIKDWNNVKNNIDKFEIFNKIYLNSQKDYDILTKIYNSDNIILKNCMSIFKNQIINNKPKQTIMIGIHITRKNLNEVKDIINTLRITRGNNLKNVVLFINSEKDRETLNSFAKTININKNLICSNIVNFSSLKQFTYIFSDNYYISLFSFLQQIPVIIYNNSQKVLNLVSSNIYNFYDNSDYITNYKKLLETKNIKNIFNNIYNNIEHLDIDIVSCSKLTDIFEFKLNEIKQKINLFQQEFDINIIDENCKKIAYFYLTNNTDILQDFTNLTELKSIYINYLLTENTPSLNLINSYYKKTTHRSGWKYVVDNIKKSISSNYIIDLYVDKTFHWDNTVNEYLKITPYTKNWVGFLHHTFDKSIKYNTEILFNNKNFMNSLKSCKGIICLTTYLKNQLSLKFSLLNINVPVYNIIHPTMLNVNKFTMNNFKDNEDKCILHIGSWLRNVDMFYYMKDITIKIKKEECNIRKIILEGCKCKDICKNKLEILNEDIEIIPYVNDDDYDELLNKNIVFLNLVDCSAVNTLLECIARNTPLVINKHPSVVELLGSDYPLYYENLDDLDKLITYNNILSGSVYLNRLDKTNLDINSFLYSLKNILL